MGAANAPPSFPTFPTRRRGRRIPGFDPSIFNGIAAPAGTTPGILVILQREIAKAVKQPGDPQSGLTSGCRPYGKRLALKQFTEFLSVATERMSKIVRDTE